MRCSLLRRCSTAYRFRDSSVLTPTPLAAEISLKLRPSSSCATNTSRCSGGSSASADANSSSTAFRMNRASGPASGDGSSSSSVTPASSSPPRRLGSPSGTFLRNTSVIRLRATRNSQPVTCSIGISSALASTSFANTSCRMSSASRLSRTRRRMKFRSRDCSRATISASCEFFTRCWRRMKGCGYCRDMRGPLAGLTCVLLLHVPPAVARQSPPALERHEFVIHDFRTESGAVLPAARIVYTTLGTLNAAGDNAVLLPSHYMANFNGYSWLIGAKDRALDPARDFLVLTELFGNGRSSSPSNTPEPFHGPRFPITTIRDNVEAVHRLLANELG